MIITQINRDASVDALVVKISEFYQFITEDNRLSKLTSMQDILKSMADQILDRARFIKNYSERKNFCVSLSNITTSCSRVSTSQGRGCARTSGRKRML